jgi:hypothetical protein
MLCRVWQILIDVSEVLISSIVKAGDDGGGKQL